LGWGWDLLHPFLWGGLPYPFWGRGSVFFLMRTGVEVGWRMEGEDEVREEWG